MQDWADVIDVIYEVLSLENTASGPNVLNHQELLLSPSECRQCSPSKFRHFSRCWRKQESALGISGGKPHLPKYTSVSFECKAPTENFRHTGTHILRGHIRLGITSEVVPDGLFSS